MTAARYGLPIATGMALVGLVWGGIAWRVSGPSGAAEAAGGDCASPVAVRVVAPPQLAPTVQQVASGLDGPCATYTVQGLGAADALATLRDQDKRPALWIAESPEQLAAARLAMPGVSVPEGTVLARSPIVAGLTRQGAADLAPQGRLAWSTLVQPDVSVHLSDPRGNGIGERSLLSWHRALETPQEVEAIVTAASPAGLPKTTQAVGAALFRTASGVAKGSNALDTAARPGPNGAKDVYLLSEQEAANQGAAAGLVAVPFDRGSLAMEYRAVPLPSTSAQTVTATSRLAAALTGADAVSRLTSAGLRVGDGPGPTVRTPSGDTRLETPELPAAPPQMANVAALQWARLTSPLRMIALFDTSGSMKTPIPGQGPRVAVAAQAAARAAASLPAATELGLWEFGNHAGKRGNWRQMLPVTPLGPPGSAGRAKLGATLATLPARVGGDTPMYNTILDAVNTLRQGYDADKDQAVIVITDGRNDDPSGLTLEQLVAALKMNDDSGKVVHVLTIGVGPDTDPAALQKISAATRTDSFVAHNPADLDSVVQKALMTVAGG